MGVTGATGSLNAGLPALLKRIKQYSGNVPTAVGFGVSTREHFLSVADIADGVVIGSQIITTLSEAVPGERAKAAEEYCVSICGRRNTPDGPVQVNGNGTAHTNGNGVPTNGNSVYDNGNGAHINGNGTVNGKGDQPSLEDEEEARNLEGRNTELFPARFGEFGGSYSPESLMNCLSELEVGFEKVRNDPEFWAEFRSYYAWLGRPSHLHVADRLTEHVGGATIWLKREDLNHTGSHKINSALGQILLARRLGKTEIIAQTGAGMHGVATATVCAKFNMKCTIFMGAVSEPWGRLKLD
jgi:tryptophan synthase